MDTSIVIKLTGRLKDLKNLTKNINFASNSSQKSSEMDSVVLIEDDKDDTEAPTTTTAAAAATKSTAKLQFAKKDPQQSQSIQNIAISLTIVVFFAISIVLLVTALTFKPAKEQLQRQPQPLIQKLLKEEQSVHERFRHIHGQLKDLSICLTLFNMSALNGACLVHQAKSFDDAQRLCSAHNMTLLEIGSQEERARVTEETTAIFGSGGGTRIWINGKFSSRVGGWLAVPRDETFFLTQEHIQPKYYGGQPRDGDCLVIESMHREVYHVSAVDCTGQSYFYCEF